MSSEQQIKIGLSSDTPCHYLSGRTERVAVALDDIMHSPPSYELLLTNGFRRSGDTIYIPYCKSCSSCQAIRVSIANFTSSKSQKRIRSKAREHSLRWEVKSKMDHDWFELYSHYIHLRHSSDSDV